MPIGVGALEALRGKQRRTAVRTLTLLLVGVMFAVGAQLAPFSPAVQAVSADSPAAPKAVFIVGPTGSLTDDNLADAEKMARQAEAAGMDVRRVLFPNATWDNVLANIQGASLVVYMGHGYGWPSPYTTKLTESRQNGMGLNAFAGSGRNEYRYYGATPIRQNVELAPNAVVFLNHLCYAAGNAEPGMQIPGEDLARQRVDNMASGWLAVGARAVFAYGWWQRLNYPQALMSTDQTMEELFMTRSDGSPSGFVGAANSRFESGRTAGAYNHLDPHNRYGFYRALSGDLSMSAADFRAGARGDAGAPAPSPDDGEPPEILSLSASASGSSPTALGDPLPAFHPNGDGIADELVVTHTVSKAAHLDVSVRSSTGELVRTFSAWSPRGTSNTRWNGRDAAGAYVPDGAYSLTYVARDDAGLSGAPASIDVLVLTAIAVGKPSVAAFHASDADRLSRSVRLPLTLHQNASLTWSIVDESGAVARTVLRDGAVGAGPAPFTWDGRRDDGSWAADGWYRSVITARTDAGTYTHAQPVYQGAFRITPSASSVAPGGKLTVTIVSTEALSTRPRVTVFQPGVKAQGYSTTRITKRKYKVTFTLRAGDPGQVQIRVDATDSRGGSQRGSIAVPLG